LEASRLTLSIRKIDGLAQVQEPGGTGGKARGGGRLGQKETVITSAGKNRVAATTRRYQCPARNHLLGARPGTFERATKWCSRDLTPLTTEMSRISKKVYRT